MQSIWDLGQKTNSQGAQCAPTEDCVEENVAADDVCTAVDKLPA